MELPKELMDYRRNVTARISRNQEFTKEELAQMAITSSIRAVLMLFLLLRK